MSETHELKLKIDAGAAKRGASEFKGAVESVRRAVRDLETDSSGAFTSLKRVDTSGLRKVSTEAATAAKSVGDTGRASDRAAERIRKLALQSANSLRVSTDQASRLRDRLLSVGDTQGLAKLEAGLDRLRNSLANATSGLDVREARAAYADLASELNRTARESERLRAETISAARAQEDAAAAANDRAAALSCLRAAHDPLYANSQRYEQSLREIAQLEDAGAMSAATAAQARARAAQSLQAASAANAGYAKAANTSTFATANMAAQFNDIGVMLASGQSPLLLAVQQGTQVSQVLNQMGNKASILSTLKAGFASMINPVSLATVGIIAGGAALAQWAISALKTESATESLTRQLDTLSTLSTELSGTLNILEMDATQLAEKYGTAAGRVRELAIAQAELRRGEIIDALKAQVAELGFITTRYKQARGAAMLYSNGIKNIASDFRISRTAAAEFEGVLLRLGNATTFEEQREALRAIVDHAEEAGIELSQFPPELRAAAIQMIDLSNESDALQQLLHNAADAIAGATGQTNAWAGAMSGVRAEINAIGSALASIGGGVFDNAAKSAELTALQAGKSVKEAATARIRFKKEQEFAAREMAAAADGGISGFFQKQLIEAERFQFEEGLRLDAELDAARAAAREAASSSSGSSGGTRSTAMSEEAQATERLTESLQNRLTSLEQERIALELTASGQFHTAEGARLMAEAMIESGGAVDAQTEAMIRQIDAAAKLNEELKKVATDPVKEWMDSVPNWIEAGQQIEMGAINHLKDAISEFIQTGKFDIESLGEAILGTIADIVADKAVAELANLLGRGEGDGLGGLLGGLFGSLGDDATGPTMGQGADVAQGGMQAGQHISTAMIQAGTQVSQQLSQAMTQGGQMAGQGVQQGHAVGGQQAANAQRVAGVQHGQQVRMATTTSGQQHATSVRTAIETGGQQHASMVSAASAGGTSGGGFLSSLGGAGGLFSMVLGAFSEGGFSNSPVGMATMPASAFRHAKHYSEGTANTSGIPAVLHDNEAVIPLSKGRKVGVEINGGKSVGGQTVNYAPTYNIQTPDADSFRRTQNQTAAEGLSAAQRALKKNG